MRKINELLRLYNTDLKFAQRLLRVPMTMRMEWLTKKTQKALSNSTFEEALEITELLNNLTMEALKREWERIDNENP